MNTFVANVLLVCDYYIGQRFMNTMFKALPKRNIESKIVRQFMIFFFKVNIYNC